MLSRLRRLFTSEITYPPAPEGFVIYAVGDVHGHADLLARVQAAIDADAADRTGKRIVEVYLGDYVDRGPQSRDVLQALLSRKVSLEPERTIITLKGNHEAAVLDFLSGQIGLEAWIAFGGAATLMSYGVTPDINDEERVRSEFAARVIEHRQFLQNLQTYFVLGGYLFVHAGVKPGVPLDRQGEEQFLWIRDEFLDFGGSFGSIVVHGHTPVDEADFQRNRINIDTGAYATRKLTCLRIDGNGPQLLPVATPEGAGR